LKHIIVGSAAHSGSATELLIEACKGFERQITT
jgi:hypothetical protein